MNDDSRKRILARRARFMVAAIAASGVACASVDDPQPGTTDAAADTQAVDDAPADTRPMADTGPMPCLEPPEDTGTRDTGSDARMDAIDSATDTAGDTGPAPCLKMPPPDGG